MSLPENFLELRQSLPEAARKALPLRPRLVSETAEAMLQITDTYWLVIVPDEGEPELCQFLVPESMALRLQQLLARNFMGHVYMFEGRRVLVSDPPQPHLIFADGRLLPLSPIAELLQVNPEGVLDPENWQLRLQRAMSRRRRPRPSAGDYPAEEYAAAGVDTGESGPEIMSDEPAGDDLP